MKNFEKAARICELLDSLRAINDFYTDSENGWYYDYDTVIQNLEETINHLEATIRCTRPENLPAGMAWSEKPYDPDDPFDPYVYDGSMDADDFLKAQEAYLSESIDPMSY